MSQRVRIYAAVLAAILLVASRGQAREIKFGVVDFQKIFEESAAIQKLNSQLEEQVKAEETTISRKRESLQKKKEELDKQQAVLDAAVKAEREEQLRQELKDLQRYATDKQEEFQRTGSELMQKVMKELSDIVKEIGDKEGYTAILERSSGGVVYFGQSTEITDQVKQEYEKRNK